MTLTYHCEFLSGFCFKSYQMTRWRPGVGNLRLPPSCDICSKKPPYWTSCRKSTAQGLAVTRSVSRKHGPVPLAVMITVTMSHLGWNSFSKGFRISCASLKSRSHWRSDGNNSNHFICFFEIPYSHHALPSESSQKHSSGLCQTPLLCGQIREA